MSNLIPILVVALGGLMAVGGSLWLAVNNMKSERDTKEVSVKLLDTAQDAAARMGNDKTRDELIQARTRQPCKGHYSAVTHACRPIQ
jgi:hypothetical protein